MASNQLDSILQIPMFTIYGLQVSNNATTPNTQLDISAGICRDDQNNVNMVLGTLFPNASGQTFVAPITIDATKVGVNGIDAGSLAASSVYAVYLIGDSRGYKVPAGLLSLATNANPTMPFDYDSKRLIGYAITDSSVHFLKGKTSGLGSERTWTYDAPQIVLSGGNATSATAVSLAAVVPPVDNIPIYMYVNFAANAAADNCVLQGGTQTGNAVIINAPVAGSVTPTTQNVSLLSQLVSSVPKYQYHVSAGATSNYLINFRYSL